MVARYYSSSLGRFLAVDPTLASASPASPQTWNRYTYGLNNPLILIDPTGAIVQVSGSGQNQGVQDLADETHQDLSVNDQGQLQAADFIGPRTEGQQMVENAIASPNTVSLNFENGNNAYNFGRNNGQGSHDIDVADTAELKTSANTSSFTAGGVVLHELAEGYAQTSLPITGTAHQFANTVSPGLSPHHSLVETGVWGTKSSYSVLTATVTQALQGVSGGSLSYTIRFVPPVSSPIPQGYPAVGPISAVRSNP